jgi:short-subunit dehydrogenase
VLAVARRGDRLDALAAQAAGWGGRIEPLVADLQEPDGIARVSGRAAELDVDVLVNCAGYADYGAFLELAEDHADRLIQLNVIALTRLTRTIAPGMVARGKGNIVNVSSGMGFQAVPYFSAYAASKAFVLSFSEGLAAELAGTGVTVQALCPGVTRTEFGSVPGVDEALARFPAGTSAEVVSRSLRGMRRGQVVVTVGAFTGLMGVLARLTPRRLNRWFGAWLMRPRALPRATA